MRALSALALVAAAAAARPAYIANPLAYNLTTFQTELDPKTFVPGDYDAISVVWDAYGVPWASFISNAPLPAWWEDRLNRTLAAVAAWKLPVVLTLSMGGGSARSCPAQNASDAGVSDVLVCGQCFDYNVVTNPLASFFRQGFANFALFMASRFGPAAMAYAIDLNRVADLCPEQWGSHVDFSNQVYSTLKNFAPSLSVYPSFSHESIMGINDGQPCKGLGGGSAVPPPAIAECVRSGLATISSLQRDAFAVSVYPTSAALGGNGVWQLWYLPAVWDALDAKDAAVIAITQYGYGSAGLTVNFANGTTPLPEGGSAVPVVGGSAAAAAALAGSLTAPEQAPAAAVLRGVAAGPQASPTPQCVAITTGSTSDSADFLGYLVDASTRYSMAYIGLYSARDMMSTDSITSCPCKVALPANQPFCTYLSLYRQICENAGVPPVNCEASVKISGSLAARNSDGSTKANVYAALQAARVATSPVHPWFA